jgi:hypothetical protein
VYVAGASIVDLKPSQFWPIAERIATETYREHALDPKEPASPVQLARLILEDDDPIVDAPWLRSGNAALLRLHGRTRIAIRPDVPIERALFAICHELAHFIFERIGFHEEPIENACDCLAACLMSPKPAMQRLVRAHGADPAIIASTAVSTQTWASMRIGEVLSVPVLFYDETRGKTRPRGGAEQLELFRDRDLLRAVTRRNLVIPGLKKVRLYDGRGRYAFIAK